MVKCPENFNKAKEKTKILFLCCWRQL